MAIPTDSRDVLQKYLTSIQEYKTLSFEDEQALAVRWRDKQDREAANQLINAHLRLVVKVAIGFKGYGLPVSEIIQEGNIGLIHAVTRFDPEKGFRLSTYAMWWIRASIQEYVLNSWSLVKIGTTASQKKLFFNLRKLRNRLEEVDQGDLSPEGVKFIAKELGVKSRDVISMDQRLMANDQSLNAMVSSEDGHEWIDWLTDDKPNQEQNYGDKEVLTLRRKALSKAIKKLDEREREIFVRRRLTDNGKAPTLDDLSHIFGISRERVRQLEIRAFNKVKKSMSLSMVVAV